MTVYEFFFVRTYVSMERRSSGVISNLFVNIMRTYKTSDFPKGVTKFVTICSSDLRTGTERNRVYCYRCGELGHRKSECVHWKTRTCSHFENGQCHRESCPFAHGTGELRDPFRRECIPVPQAGNKFAHLASMW